MCGETIPSETLERGLNKWSIKLTRLSQRSVAVSHSIIHIAVSYGNSTNTTLTVLNEVPSSRYDKTLKEFPSLTNTNSGDKPITRNIVHIYDRRMRVYDHMYADMYTTEGQQKY